MTRVVLAGQVEVLRQLMLHFAQHHILLHGTAATPSHTAIHGGVNSSMLRSYTMYVAVAVAER